MSVLLLLLWIFVKKKKNTASAHTFTFYGCFAGRSIGLSVAWNTRITMTHMSWRAMDAKTELDLQHNGESRGDDAKMELFSRSKTRDRSLYGRDAPQCRVARFKSHSAGKENILFFFFFCGSQLKPISAIRKTCTTGIAHTVRRVGRFLDQWPVASSGDPNRGMVAPQSCIRKNKTVRSPKRSVVHSR
jgi:hypothetical protein